MKTRVTVVIDFPNATKSEVDARCNIIGPPKDDAADLFRYIAQEAVQDIDPRVELGQAEVTVTVQELDA